MKWLFVIISTCSISAGLYGNCVLADVGAGNHSIFATTFMRILNENTGVLDGHQLFTTLRKQVMMNAYQTPEYGDIRKAGHDGGDFLFVRQ